jgi:hypothetical protein
VIKDPAAATLFNIMLRRHESASYALAGSREIAGGAPPRGGSVSLSIDGRLISAVVDELYIPPGCDVHCIGTLFITETGR